jgi:hypothetical protein
VAVARIGVGDERNAPVDRHHEPQIDQAQVGSFLFGLASLGDGYRSLAEAMKVAKLVMSSASSETSASNELTIRSVIRRSISVNCFGLILSIASQKRQWSSAPRGIFTRRASSVVSPQSEKPSLDEGASTPVEGCQ